ncbi:MAG TPA: hypothetical protein VMC09_15460 [Anaerolineales bacterium]|nr:hypothetical protein [Anaerolineales bacterium]
MKKTVFESTVDEAFWGLESKFGFKKVETKYVDRTVAIRFQNMTTEVCLNYEIGDTPWLEIADLHKAENKSTLGWLLVERGEQKAPTPAQAFRPATLSESELKPTLVKMGQQIVTSGADLLQGNFEILPKLQARAKKYNLECERYLATHKPKS